ncbi:cell wall hydrolase [Aurantimonas sp. 22II-16-19i]|uniref:cell wall hydrolase n=1 Tax=Aurantimonas sp. 22II-16-19i TaxID=1317114 RepID=UPI0009F7A838|nr:cell wall hydrolase [Aurantimonas sp. 22II-16-19i]ORE90822.1 spore-cortex-lytic enzyme prepeptide [Aurantimonas sp. 22II-16-19i]
MSTTHRVTSCRLGLLVALALPLAGCVGAPGADEAFEALATRDLGPSQECLARAMYFESNRSSEDGMLAVGTVVMNRVASADYPNDVCAVVGQPKQFAPGVMTRSMGVGEDLAMQVAARVLRGERHKTVAKAKFFHTAGMNFPYRNMSYRLIAGGNAFYEKISRRSNPEARIVSQAEVRQAQNASGAIDLMRTASTKPQKPGTTAIGYAEPASPSAAAAPVPSERPGEASAPPSKSPFLDMFKTRQAAAAETDERGGRVGEAAAVAQETGTSVPGDLPGVEDGAAASATGTSTEAHAGPSDSWLARW